MVKGKGKEVHSSLTDEALRLQDGNHGESSRTKDHKVYLEKGKLLTIEYLRTSMGHLAMPPEAELDKVGMLTTSWEVFAGRMALLKDRGLIINTVDFDPSRDDMLAWITQNLIQDLGIEVSQLKVLEKFIFLAMLEKAEDRKKIWEETLFYMNGKMILEIPCEPSFDPKTTRTTAAPIWMDLLTLNPVFEDDVKRLFGLVGSVVYPTMKYARRKYSNVRGCVKVDFMQPLEDFMVANVLGIGTFRIDVEYQMLLDACFYYQKWGHMIHDFEAFHLMDEDEMKR